jgi:hypothetical protein
MTKFVDDLKMAARSQRIRPNTKHISLMQASMFDILVTDNYLRTFKANLVSFGVPLPVSVRTRNNKGTPIKEICIDVGNYQPIKILSDGEKRIASLADFLTEVSLDPNAAGIVLDDPVTSLDMEWKEGVAKRLVEEAEKRQTIIFTHDLYFVYYLKQFAESADVGIQCHWIIRETHESPPGCVYLNNSPALEKDYRSPTKAEELWQEAKAAAPQDRESLLKSGFSALRTSYEALVMYELFNGVVERFQERTRIDLLDKVVLDKKLFDFVRQKHGLLSHYMEGHLHSDSGGGKKPTPESLKAEIDDFIKLKSQIKALKKTPESSIAH